MPDYPEHEEDRIREQHEHEQEMARLAHPKSEWAITVRIGFVWAVIGFVACFYIWASK